MAILSRVKTANNYLADARSLSDNVETSFCLLWGSSDVIEVHKLLVAAPGTYSSCAVLNSTLLQYLPPDRVLVVAKASAFL